MLGYRVGGIEHQRMHLIGLVLFSIIFAFWILQGLRIARGALRLPHLKNQAPCESGDCPSISLIFAARNEAEKLPQALATLETIDYPGLEIIAVDDRSTDRTSAILRGQAERDGRFQIVSVEDLPGGWLGKPHALQGGYEASKGEWLLFTDADVCFKPDSLRRAMRLAKLRGLDHLTLMGDVEMHGFWEKTVLSFFALGFYIGTNPAAVSDPNSSAYLGVGAFQLLKRHAYEMSGTHRRLAMEVVDDLKLGKIVKRAGYRSGVGLAGDYVSVRWHAGLGNIVSGVTKNFFAVAGYRIDIVALQLAGITCTNVLPFAALPFVHGWTWVLAAASAAIALAAHAGTARVMKASGWYAGTQPLGAIIFGYMLLRSTVVTLKQGGVVWRDTFYPLDALRRGLV
jgi:glycosyltransferase involved in cell wall biosynthesis